jgi:hypothetical protein
MIRQWMAAERIGWEGGQDVLAVNDAHWPWHEASWGKDS